MAQWKRAGPITQRSEDRNLALLQFLFVVVHLILKDVLAIVWTMLTVSPIAVQGRPHLAILTKLPGVYLGAFVAQWFARSAVNRKAGGSTPPEGADNFLCA